MASDKNDEEIVNLYKNGNPEALKILINRYTAPLFNFTARLVGKNETSDIVQEIFIKVWKNIDRFDSEKASFKTWIFTIARNSITDFLRKRKNLVFSDMFYTKEEEPDTARGDNSFEENIPSEDLLPDEAIQKLQDSQFLNRILEKLHPEYREVLILHYQEEMTFEEIGKVLDKSANTVKSQHRRAIIKLREMLEDNAPK